MDRKTLYFIVFSTAFISLIAFSDWEPDDGHKMHYPQLPNELGWDVNASYCLPTVGLQSQTKVYPHYCYCFTLRRLLVHKATDWLRAAAA